MPDNETFKCSDNGRSVDRPVDGRQTVTPATIAKATLKSTE